MPDEVPSTKLSDEVKQFADALNSLVARVLDSPEDSFEVQATEGTTATRIIIRQRDPDGIALHVDGEPRLRLKASFHCSWDHCQEFLAVLESSFTVLLDSVSEPLFHYDYRANGDGNVPASHLNVHGHRDELVFAMMAAGHRHRGRSRHRSMQKGRVPRLSDLHFPMGGHRFRPSFEDVMDIVVREFGIQTQDGWQHAISEGRAAWREKQLRSAVRDDPEAAVEVLRHLGYTVRLDDNELPPQRRLDRITAL